MFFTRLDTGLNICDNCPPITLVIKVVVALFPPSKLSVSVNKEFKFPLLLPLFEFIVNCKLSKLPLSLSLIVHLEHQL